MYKNSTNKECKIYVGNLPGNIRTKDLEDIFYKYGKIVDVDLHNSGRVSIPFAFIEFEDARDAEEAVKGRDGYSFDGYKLKVEFPKKHREHHHYHRGGGMGGGGGFYRGGGMFGYAPTFGMRGRGGWFGFHRGFGFGYHHHHHRGFGRGFGPHRGGGFIDFNNRSKRPVGYQVLVSNLPTSGSWQDLKDHFREAGDVIFADVYKDGTGSVEFARMEHMKRALRDLDDSKFKSHEGDTTYIRVKAPQKPFASPYRSRSRSPRPRAYSRSLSKSKSRSRSVSRSTSR